MQKSEANNGPILEVKNACKDYAIGGLFQSKQMFQAVRDVSLALKAGETLGIVGESGSGKSTLASIILGILEPTSGSIKITGDPLQTYSRLKLARIVQPVFQNPFASLNPRHDVSRLISMPLQIHHIGDQASRNKQVKEMMAAVGLAPRFANRYPAQLSGGQRQRVAIARALALRPKILVCDEPTSALDVSVQAQILNLLLEIKSQYELSLILISHDLSVIEHMADRVLVMCNGELVEEADAAQIFRNPQHEYTKELLRAILLPSVPEKNCENAPAKLKSNPPRISNRSRKKAP